MCYIVGTYLGKPAEDKSESTEEDSEERRQRTPLSNSFQKKIFMMKAMPGSGEEDACKEDESSIEIVPLNKDYVAPIAPAVPQEVYCPATLKP